jgi:hypothetical protein
MAGPYAPGEVGPPAHLGEDELAGLMRTMLADNRPRADAFVWRTLDSELYVEPREARVAVLDGLVLAGIPTRCVELGRIEMVVPVATGTEPEPAGMVMAAETVARGPQLLVDIWGETLVAAVWIAFIDVCRSVAASAGEDRRCRPLLPGAVYAEPGRLTIVPQARHAVDWAGAA